MSEPVPVVHDVNVLVGAAAGGNSPFRSWPSPPPTSGNPFADCLGVVVDAAEFGLWLSPHILDNTARVLAEGLKWDLAMVEKFISLLVEICDHSGGGVVDPAATVSDCSDWEDNRILDLAAEVGALLIVSDDADLTSMSPWRGTPVLRPREFAAKVDGMRRHRRRR
ncbi:putative nucleic acid-binding protein [Streptacidiphilus sp. MAP12-16]|uniref:PIN domain-containing protein n=1 Tax=Streptacidiphilus sp. MAP12-16 TaxID=3156300 RepID=UPI003517B235